MNWAGGSERRDHVPAAQGADAPVATVWQLISDMRNWPTWRSDAYVTKLDAIEPDARFRWKIRGVSIRATFAVIAPERELAWTGTATGGWVKAIDRCRLAPTEDGRTAVTMEESMSGQSTVSRITR